MTPERLAEIRALLAAATPGPLFVKRCDSVDDPGLACAIATTPGGYRGDNALVTSDSYDECGHIMAAGDAALWAEAPTAIAELLVEVDRLRAAVDPPWIEVNRPWDSDYVAGEFVPGVDADDELKAAILTPGVQVVVRDAEGVVETLIIGDLGPRNGCEGCGTDFYGDTIVRYRQLVPEI